MRIFMILKLYVRVYAYMTDEKRRKEVAARKKECHVVSRR